MVRPWPTPSGRLRKSPPTRARSATCVATSPRHVPSMTVRQAAQPGVRLLSYARRGLRPLSRRRPSFALGSYSSQAPVAERSKHCSGHGWTSNERRCACQIPRRAQRPFTSRRRPWTYWQRAPRIAGNRHVITGEREGAYFVGLFKCWKQIRDAATVKSWMADAGSPAATIVSSLTQSLDRVPTYEECVAAAEAKQLELPVGLSNLRLHDLRHAFASVAASLDMGLPIIGKMLGHARASTTQRYAHLAPDPAKAAAASVAVKIADGLCTAA